MIKWKKRWREQLDLAIGPSLYLKVVNDTIYIGRDTESKEYVAKLGPPVYLGTNKDRSSSRSWDLVIDFLNEEQPALTYETQREGTLVATGKTRKNAVKKIYDLFELVRDECYDKLCEKEAESYRAFEELKKAQKIIEYRELANLIADVLIERGCVIRE